MISPQTTQTSGSNQGQFIAYGHKSPRAYKLAYESTSDMPNSLMAFGFMFRDEELAVAGSTALGNKKTNQDRFNAVALAAHTRLLSPTDKMQAMNAVAKTLGNALLSDKNGRPCMDEDTRDEDCLAKGSGSTMASVLIDSTGITVSNVGDSYVLGVIVHPDGKVNVRQLNTLDTINAHTIADLKLDAYPPGLSRGTVGGLQFARAFGDIEARDSGVRHESTESHFCYKGIAGYAPGVGDKLYIVVASDGLIDSVAVDPFLSEYEAAQEVFTKSNQALSDFRRKYDAFDLIDKKKQDLIFTTFAASIAQALDDQADELVINAALVNTLGVQNRHNLATLPDNLTIVVAAVDPTQDQAVLIAVYDGHGSTSDGHIAADYLARKYPQALTQALTAKIDAVVESQVEQIESGLPENPRVKDLLSRGRVTTSGSRESDNSSPYVSGRSTPSYIKPNGS